MDKIANIIELVRTSDDKVGVIIGLVFIVIAILVGVFKQHWLIAGVNTAPKKDLAKIDLEYVGKYFGIFFGIFGFIIFLGSFLCILLNISMDYFGIFLLPFTLAFVVFLFWYGYVKKNRIYKKK